MSIEDDRSSEENARLLYELLRDRKYDDAVKIAINDSVNMRTRKVIQELDEEYSIKDGLLQYFLELSEHSVLNEHESITFCKLASYKSRHIQILYEKEKLTLTEQLADVLKSIETNIAMNIYISFELHEKVIECLLMNENYKEIPVYAKKTQYKPDYISIMNSLMDIGLNRGCSFAQIFLDETIEFNDLDKVVDVFSKYSLLQECTSFLIEKLKHNRESEGNLQTRLIEMNLLNATDVADTILNNRMFSHFDRAHIAELCEKCGLYKHAIELYTDLKDFKKLVELIVNTHLISTEWLIDYFATLDATTSLEFMKAMLEANISNNLTVCVQIAIKYQEKLTLKALINLFDSFKSYDGLFNIIEPFIDTNKDPEVHFKYIEAACKIGKYNDLERICMESDFYEPERVKNFLFDADLPHPLPLIIVCDRFHFLNELVVHLYKRNMIHYIEAYVIKVNASRLPAVVGGLLDVGCNEEKIKQIIVKTPPEFSIQLLSRECEQRNRVVILKEYLEEKVKQGSTDAMVHSSLAKVHIVENNNPEQYLKQNLYYLTRVVGNFCEKSHPYLAYIAYERGHCDDDLIRLCNANNFLKEEAIYLTKRNKRKLWSEVLNKKNPNWRKIIDHFLDFALNERVRDEELKTAVEAFLLSDLKNEFVEIIEHSIPQDSMLYKVSNEYLET